MTGCCRRQDGNVVRDGMPGCPDGCIHGGSQPFQKVPSKAPVQVESGGAVRLDRPATVTTSVLDVTRYLPFGSRSRVKQYAVCPVCPVCHGCAVHAGSGVGAICMMHPGGGLVALAHRAFTRTVVTARDHLDCAEYCGSHPPGCPRVCRDDGLFRPRQRRRRMGTVSA